MFSNDARWDRHLPYQPHEEEAIEVGVIFKNGQMIPTCFKIQKRKIDIKEITYSWKDKRGGVELHFFSASDGVNLYQIFLNTKHMSWRLKRSEPL